MEISENDSEDSRQAEEPFVMEEPFIMDRFGPHSVDMSEEELEMAFSQLSLAFLCDQCTLCQRLETEEHARDNAEDNLKLEVERSIEVLETLRSMCLDVKRAGLLQHLELSLNIIRGTIGRISNTAETLGAVQQEAKMSRAVELMMAHVENLRRRHERNSAELEELKKQMDKGCCDHGEENESPESTDHQKSQSQSRRRISTSIIIKRQKSKDSETTSAMNDPSEPKESSSNKPSDSSDGFLLLDRGSGKPTFPDNNPKRTLTTDEPEDTTVSTRVQTLRSEKDSVLVKKSSLLVLRPRRKAIPDQRSERSLQDCDGCVGRLQRPVVQWLYHCRWIILVIYLTVLCSIIILAITVWFLQTPVLWM